MIPGGGGQYRFGKVDDENWGMGGETGRGEREMGQEGWSEE